MWVAHGSAVEDEVEIVIVSEHSVSWEGTWNAAADVPVWWHTDLVV